MSTLNMTKQAYLEDVSGRIGALRARPVRLAEIGVGIGNTAIALAKMLGPRDRLIAIDRDSTNLARFEEKARELENGPALKLLTADACDLSGLADASVDVVCSDTMLNMLGSRYAAWFSQVHRMLRPGGVFAFREILPPELPPKSSRDLFFQIVMAAMRMSAISYDMIPIRWIERALADHRFIEIELKQTAGSSGLEMRLDQWHPLSDPSCPLREEFMNYFEAHRFGLDKGLPLSASYHVLCVK